MASEAGNIIRHGGLFMVANVVNRAAGLLLLPLYTKILAPPEFGVYALVVVISDLLAVMLMIGMSNAFTAVYFEHEDGAPRRKVVSTCILALLGVSVAMLGLAYPIGYAGSWAMFDGPEHAWVTAIALGSVALTTLFELGLAYFRVRKRSGLCLTVAVFKVGALLAFNVLFLWAMDLGVAGIFLANALSFAVLGLGMTLFILRENGAGFSWTVLKRVGRLGLPYMPQSLLDIANNFVARWLLNVLLSTAAVGIFALGMRLAQILYMFLTASFLQIWSVSRLEAGEKGDSEQATFVFYLFVTLLTGAGLGMALVSPEILWLIASDAYAPVLPCMPALVLVYVLHGVRMNAEVAILKAKRVGVLPWISVASLAVGTALAVPLVWSAGVFGAALAALGREVFQIVLTEIVRRRMTPGEIHLDAARLAWIILPGMAAFGVGYALFGHAVDPAYTAAKVLLVLLFLVGCLFGPGIGAGGRAILARMLPRWPRRVPSTP